jgi:hypothetical protein
MDLLPPQSPSFQTSVRRGGDDVEAVEAAVVTLQVFVGVAAVAVAAWNHRITTGGGDTGELFDELSLSFSSRHNSLASFVYGSRLL